MDGSERLSHTRIVRRSKVFGRDRELEKLQQTLTSLPSGRGELVLISGDAGIGKTSLVSTIGSMISPDETQFAVTTHYDLAITPPYAPWLDILRQISTSPETIPTLRDLVERQQSQDVLFEKALNFLRSAVTKQPAILILEDLHWSDAASLELLRFIARHVAEMPLLIIGTYRDNEIDREHPLHALLPLIVRESHAIRINLRPLTPDVIRTLVLNQYALLAPDTARLTNYLAERTEGNPFFIEETLRSIEEQGYLGLNDGQWQLGNLSDIPLPPLVQHVIEGRLARLDPRSRYLLSVAAVVGAEISLETWRDAAEATDVELSAALQQAIALHLMEEDSSDGTLTFTHALIREALYYELTLPIRRLLHEKIGRTLADAPSPDPDTVAYHLNEAGDSDAVLWLIAAGERAQHLYAWRTAAERFEAALPLLTVGPETLKAKGWLCYRTGLLLIYAAPERAISHLFTAEHVANETGDRHLAAYARADRGLIRCLTGDVRRGLAEMQSGVARLDNLPAIELAASGAPSITEDFQLNIDGIKRRAFDLIGTANDVNLRKGALIFWLAWAGRYAETIEVGERYVDQLNSDAPGIEDSLGDALAGLGHAYAALGRPNQALAAFTKARASFQAIEHHFKVGNTAIYELSEAFLPYRADHVMQREWLADQAEAG